jgi:hypothetical protein
MSEEDTGQDSGEKNPFEQSEAPRAEPSATEELKAGLGHLFNAAKKVARAAEPLANHAAKNVGSTFDSLEKAGEQVAADVGREVASIAGKLAEKLRAVADRADPSSSHPGSDNDPSRGDR